MDRPFLARLIKDADGGVRKQLLADHLNGVAVSAGEFAAKFGNRDWGQVLGWWHDLGKFHPHWQSYLRRRTGYDDESDPEGSKQKIHHSNVGAVLAMQKGNEAPPARILAYILAGHHAGLPDWHAGENEAGGALSVRLFSQKIDETAANAVLDTRLLKQVENVETAQEFFQKPLPSSPPLEGRVPMGAMREHWHLWIRMLFSCLVDADWLDTEEFMQPERTEVRGGFLPLTELKKRFDRFIAEKEQTAPATTINRLRRQVRETCMQKAALYPGFFSLTVPTGAGKTLSSVAFALEHALRWNKRRIIYVLPFTSIIEQTAKVFKWGTDLEGEIDKARLQGRCLFGEDQVVEHHSRSEPKGDGDNRAELAAENWDAPVIVTTNVQFFESLFSARPGACRKLHNIVNSIVILDEVQMLPPEYLRPLLSALKGLVSCFGVSVVLMSATQPTWSGRIGTPPNDVAGLENVRPIVESALEKTPEFDRVAFRFPRSMDEPVSWEELRDELIRHEQVLCIVNTRKDCRTLHRLMPEGTFHLSALMCAADRSRRIAEIKSRLAKGEPVRVVSTQLVEAGVDIDFPTVYRALAGLDSIAQSAGRCNRENRLAQKGAKGEMVVFVPPKPSPPGLLRKGEDACKEVVRTLGGRIDTLSQDIYSLYFRLYYGKLNRVDKPDFYDLLVRNAGNFEFQFRTLAGRFKLIDDFDESLIVFYRDESKGIDSGRLIQYLREKMPMRLLARKLQPFVVNIPRPVLNHLLDCDMVEPVGGFWVQKAEKLYRPGLGLMTEQDIEDEHFYLE